MAINKIVKLGLEESASKLKEENKSYQGIADELSRACGERITKSTVHRYFNSNRDPVVRNVKKRENVVSRAVNNRLNTAQQLHEINEACIKILKDALDEGDRSNAIKAAKEVRDQLEFQAKIIGDITSDTTVNINYFNAKFEALQKIVFEEISDEGVRARITERLLETQD